MKEAGSGGKTQSGDQDVYASSGFPKEYGENTQLRGAGTTKSFTAAAFLIRNEAGRPMPVAEALNVTVTHLIKE